jgi:hypothetical protein
MEDKKLIAQTLLEIAKKSTTEIIEVGSDFDLIETAEKLNIKLPSPDLAVIKTVYAEIDKVNKNGVVLPREAVEKGLPTLIGKQINWEHQGSGRICGYIIDAKINKDQIEIIGVIFKSLFPEEMELVKEKFEKRTLCVSFEIWNRNPENKESVVHELKDGIRNIDPIIFHGCGLLLANPPACPKAKVYKLIANKELEQAEKIVDKIFEEDLIYASLALEETESSKKEEPKVAELYELLVAETLLEITEEEIASFENDEGEEVEEAKKLKYEERQKLSDDDFAVVITVKNKVTGEPRKIRMFPINDEAHVRNALARLPQAEETLKKLGISKEEVLKKILKRAKELNMDELLKKYEKSSEETQAEVKPEETKTEEKSEVAETKTEETKAEETKEEPKVEAQALEVVKEEKEKPIKTVSYYISENIEIVGEDGGIDYQSKSYEKIIRTYKDGREEIEIREGNSVNDSKVSKYTSAQLEEKVNAAKSEKDTEIATLKTAHENALKEKDTEIQNKTEELGKKDQEIADLKNPKVEEPKEKEMAVGAVETKDNYKKIQDEVNEKGFGKR